MDDKAVQQKLDQLVEIANELAEEASRRYGIEGQLFFEAEGDFHFMKHDDGGKDRQKGCVLRSRTHCRMNCGAW